MGDIGYMPFTDLSQWLKNEFNFFENGLFCFSKNPFSIFFHPIEIFFQTFYPMVILFFTFHPMAIIFSDFHPMHTVGIGTL